MWLRISVLSSLELQHFRELKTMSTRKSVSFLLSCFNHTMTLCRRKWTAAFSASGLSSGPISGFISSGLSSTWNTWGLGNAPSSWDKKRRCLSDSCSLTYTMLSSASWHTKSSRCPFLKGQCCSSTTGVSLGGSSPWPLSSLSVQQIFTVFFFLVCLLALFGLCIICRSDAMPSRAVSLASSQST